MVLLFIKIAFTTASDNWSPLEGSKGFCFVGYNVVTETSSYADTYVLVDGAYQVTPLTPIFLFFFTVTFTPLVLLIYIPCTYGYIMAYSVDKMGESA